VVWATDRDTRNMGSRFGSVLAVVVAAVMIGAVIVVVMVHSLEKGDCEILLQIKLAVKERLVEMEPCRLALEVRHEGRRDRRNSGQGVGMVRVLPRGMMRCKGGRGSRLVVAAVDCGGVAGREELVIKGPLLLVLIRQM